MIVGPIDVHWCGVPCNTCIWREWQDRIRIRIFSKIGGWNTNGQMQNSTGNLRSYSFMRRWSILAADEWCFPVNCVPILHLHKNMSTHTCKHDDVRMFTREIFMTSWTTMVILWVSFPYLLHTETPDQWPTMLTPYLAEGDRLQWYYPVKLYWRASTIFGRRLYWRAPYASL